MLTLTPAVSAAPMTYLAALWSGVALLTAGTHVLVGPEAMNLPTQGLWDWITFADASINQARATSGGGADGRGL